MFWLSPDAGSGLPILCDQLWPWAGVVKDNPANPSQRLSIKFHSCYVDPFLSFRKIVHILTHDCPLQLPEFLSLLPNPTLSTWIPDSFLLDLLGTIPCLPGLILQTKEIERGLLLFYCASGEWSDWSTLFQSPKPIDFPITWSCFGKRPFSLLSEEEKKQTDPGTAALVIINYFMLFKLEMGKENFTNLVTLLRKDQLHLHVTYGFFLFFF